MTQRKRRKHLPSLSTLLILMGVALMVVGTYSAFQYRPRPLTAAEQAALDAGEARAAASIAPVLLPAPGVADLSEKGEITSLGDAPNAAVAPSDPAPQPAPALPGSDDEPVAVHRPGATPTTAPPTVAPPRPTAAPVAPSIPAKSPPDRIAAPTIGLDSKVIEVGWKTIKQGNQWFSEWDTADYAVGFHKLSARPGASGNTVFSGHNNIRGEVFRDLVDLNIGDPISVWADGREYKYLVTDKFIVREVGASLEQRMANAQWIAATDDERITLVSCWPYWTNTHRVVVVARPLAVADQFMQQLSVHVPDVPTGGADCAARPAPGAIADAWQNNDDVRKRLGCAVAKAQPVQTTQQFFKGGRMIWRPDTASIAVLYDDGRWQSVTSFNGLQPADATPTCAVDPKLGFGRVWGGLPGATTRLGCPAGDEQGVTASAQMFEGGTALVFGNAPTPVLLFRDGSWIVVRPQ